MAAYAELHCHSHYSLLDGASPPAELVRRAQALGLAALALTDHDGLYGVVPFYMAAQEAGLRPIIGAEVTLANGAHLVLLAETQAGYGHLCRLISAAQLAGRKGQPQLGDETLAAHARGLIALSGCAQGEVPAALLRGDPAAARARAAWYREVFGPRNYYVELERHWLAEDQALVAGLVALARELRLPIVATNDVHYAGEAGYRLHDVLTAIRHRCTVEELGSRRRPNSEYYLKSPAEMAALFADLPAALAHTIEIAGRCRVRLRFRDQALPSYPLPPGQTAAGRLRALCLERLPARYPHSEPQARAQLERELAVIDRAGLAGYFLVVWELVDWARARGIRLQGRGSAAGSLVAYLLGISPVDPLAHGLLFERFLSGDPQVMPDIDIDIAADRREEVIQHVYQRYGEAHTAMVCNVVTYRRRSALREVAKALGYGPEFIADVGARVGARVGAKHASPPREVASPPREVAKALGYRPGFVAVGAKHASPPREVASPLLHDMCQAIEGTPRHLSIHVGGMLITRAPLVSLVPLERATMPGRVVAQWDKDAVEDAGLIKLDLLGLRTLSVLEEATRWVREAEGVALDPERLPLDDPEVYEMAARADTVGVFQIESRAQMSMLPRLRPRRFSDLVIEVALVRPGPIQGGMVHPYLKRRAGAEPVSYLHPLLEPILAETLGVIVFQEQVLQVAMAMGGLTAAEADRFRRLLGRSPAPEQLTPWRERFIRGAGARGVPTATAEAVFGQLSAFAGYGFCKSHAAAFALLTYQTAYLKRYHPVALTCALLNHQPMGFYAPRTLLRDAQRHGVRVLPLDVNRSQANCTVEAGAVRLGYRYLAGLGPAGLERWQAAREAGPFRSLEDFCRRTALPRKVVASVIRVGAMDALGGPRRALLWELGRLDYREGTLEWAWQEPPIAWPPYSAAERLQAEYAVLGMGVEGHLLALYRPWLERLGVVTSVALAACRAGARVRVAGEMVVRQTPPTAKGYAFITLEDEEGLINLVLPPPVAAKYRPLLNEPLLAAEGVVQRQGHALSVRVGRVLPWQG
jgi:error-prone DNA polymerase